MTVSKKVPPEKKNKIEWPDLKFPPINLYNVWPTKEMLAIHDENRDPTLYDNH
jgi:hypothetical protein